ncbi:hypothetical protein MTP99_007182 [Tenebrio molitor]|nr:hypothetical protein MTP99_007182 [Tenebrio molitor]
MRLFMYDDGERRATAAFWFGIGATALPRGISRPVARRVRSCPPLFDDEGRAENVPPTPFQRLWFIGCCLRSGRMSQRYFTPLARKRTGRECEMIRINVSFAKMQPIKYFLSHLELE